MNLRFFNAYIVTPNERGFLGEVTVSGNIIQSVGPVKDESFKADREIDVKGNLLMPGLINAHTHSAMTYLRGVGEGIPLETWLNTVTFPFEKKLKQTDIYNGTLVACLDYLRNGITTVVDMYYETEAINRAFSDAGIRSFTCLYPSHGLKKEKQLDELNKRYKKLPISDLNKFLISAHSVYSYSESDLNVVSKFCKDNNLISYIHLSETLNEVGECAKTNNNMSPVMYLEKIGFFDNPCVAVHCVHVDKEDIKILKQYDVTVCSCISSNLKLGSGIPPVKTMMDNNLNVCLGTDGPASNNHLDMFKEMHLTGLVQKGLFNDAEILTNNEVFCMATVNGAKGLKQNNLGEIKKGYLADIILVDVSSASHFPFKELDSNFINSVNCKDIYLTMVNGKIVYENGQYNISADPSVIIQNASSSLVKLTKTK